MKCRRQFGAFTLLEVIIAVGLFASAVAVILALTAALSRQGAESADGLAAQRLPEPLKVELTRLAGTSFDNLASQIPIMASPLGAGLPFAAARDVSRVDSLSYLPPAGDRIPAEQQYYLVECWRFPAEPLRYDAQKAFLALHVRVSWPYRLPGVASPTALAERNQFTFTASLNR